MNDAGWGDGNLTSTTSEDYYQDAAPASAGEPYLWEQPDLWEQPGLWEQPYFWDSSQTQFETLAGPHDGSDDNITIQDQGNVQAVPSTYREYCFGMVSSPGYAIFRPYHDHATWCLSERNEHSITIEACDSIISFHLIAVELSC